MYECEPFFQQPNCIDPREYQFAARDLSADSVAPAMGILTFSGLPDEANGIFD